MSAVTVMPQGILGSAIDELGKNRGSLPVAEEKETWVRAKE